MRPREEKELAGCRKEMGHDSTGHWSPLSRLLTGGLSSWPCYVLYLVPAPPPSMALPLIMVFRWVVFQGRKVGAPSYANAALSWKSVLEGVAGEGLLVHNAAAGVLIAASRQDQLAPMIK